MNHTLVLRVSDANVGEIETTWSALTHPTYVTGERKRAEQDADENGNANEAVDSAHSDGHEAADEASEAAEFREIYLDKSHATKVVGACVAFDQSEQCQPILCACTHACTAAQRSA